MVKANHLIIHRSSTTVSSETSLLWINIFQVYINLFIYNKFTEYLLLLSWPGRRPDDGAELDTSNDTTPVSSLTAVDEGVVAVTWIPWQRKTWWKKASRSVSRVPKKHVTDNCWLLWEKSIQQWHDEKLRKFGEIVKNATEGDPRDVIMREIRHYHELNRAILHLVHAAITLRLRRNEYSKGISFSFAVSTSSVEAVLHKGTGWLSPDTRWRTSFTS